MIQYLLNNHEFGFWFSSTVRQHSHSLCVNIFLAQLGSIYIRTAYSVPLSNRFPEGQQRIYCAAYCIDLLDERKPIEKLIKSRKPTLTNVDQVRFAKAKYARTLRFL